MGATTFEPGATQQVSLTTSSSQSAAIGSGGWKQQLRILVTGASDSSAVCWLRFGSNPTAVANAGGGFSFPVMPGVPEYFDIDGGDKVAGLMSAGTAKLNITLAGK